MRTLYTLIFLFTFSFSLSGQTLSHPWELLYVHTDRTLYRPGETVWLRAYLTDPQLRLAGTPSDVVTIQLLGPAGNVLSTQHLYRGPNGHDGYLQLDQQLRGGRYTLRAYTNWLGNFGESALFTKHLYLQEAVNPNLLLQLEPERESFAPGTTVAYTLTARDRRGDFLTGREVTATLRIDGATATKRRFFTGADGITDIRLPLPANLATDDVVLTASVRDGDEVESALRTVRVSLGFIDVRFFPEGGGRSNGTHKIAFRATDRYGKPLDVSGEVLSDGIPQSVFESLHNGYGHFYVTPDDGSVAEVRLEGYPDTLFRLPPPTFFAVTAGLEITASAAIMNVSGDHGAPFFHLSLAREDSLYRQEMIGNGQTTLPLTGLPSGVYRLRLHDENNRLRWERLFFHRPSAVAISQLQERKEGNKHRHEFELRDADGKPVTGNFSVAIVDDGPYGKQNDKQPHLVAQLLLQSRLRGTLYEPNDYFDPNQPDALSALDDVLLCHGWRMYETASPEVFAYAPLKTGIFGKVYNNSLLNSRKLQVNGQKIELNAQGNYVHPIATFTSVSLRPDISYGYSYGELGEDGVNTNRNNRIARVLPYGKLFTPAPPTVQGRTAQRVKTTSYDRQEMNVAPSVEAGISEESGSSLSEIVVTGYSVSIQNALTGAVVYIDRSGDLSNYSIRGYEAELEDTYRYFYPGYTKFPLQAKYAYPAELRFSFANPSDDRLPALLYWNPGLAPDDSNTYELNHGAPRLSATYRVILEGITDGNVPVHTEQTFSVAAPFEFNTRLPARAVVGDEMQLTATVVNNGTDPIVFRDRVTADTTFAAYDKADREFTVPGGQSRTIQRRITVLTVAEKAALEWSVRRADGTKTMRQRSVIAVRPRLFTHLSTAASSGGRELSVKLNPAEHVGKVTAAIHLYGGPLDEITDTYAGMLREPRGCFEQTTSTAYPNALIVSILREQNREKYTSALRQAKSFLASGYSRMRKFENPNGGFGLWVNSKAKPRYTAMALLQFSDLAKVWDGVDPELVNRSRMHLRKHVLKSGFQRGPAQLFHLLALVTYGDPGLEDLIARHAISVANQPEEHYYALLLTRVYLARGEKERARTLVRSLVPAVTEQTLNPESESAGVGSAYGRFSQVEMLGYFIESYVETEGYDGTVEVAFSWATELKSSRGYQPTQAKIRYLRALRVLAKHRPEPEPGLLEVFINDRLIDTLHYTVDEYKTLTFDLSEVVLPGDNLIRLRFAEREHYPALRWQAEWQRELPPRSETTPLTLNWRTDSLVRVGEVVSYRLEMRNETEQTVRNPMLQIGLPGNTELLLKDLDPLVQRGVIDYYELDGHYLNLYFNELAAGATRRIPLDLTARIAGTFRAPPTVCYPYYQPHLRHFQKGPKLKVNE